MGERSYDRGDAAVATGRAARRDVRARLGPIALGGIVLVGVVMRLRNLGGTPLNFDESFTAMVGRLPLGSVFGFLRAHDSHPPLDYLLQLPFSRAGASPLVFRLPSALCSIAALILFAWWMRDRGRAGLIATAAMSVSAFQLVYAREARMYGPMELIGVGAAVLADSWLRTPRRRHGVLVAALTFAGLMTHVSMFLAAIGLLALAGLRRDSDAWRWRLGIVTGGAGWALLWGSSFLVQSRGGHSSWIPRTTAARFVDTISALVTYRLGISLAVVVAIVVGIFACARRDRVLAMVLVCCFAVPAALAGLIGLRAPVLIDRTLAVVSWGPLLALGYLVDAAVRQRPHDRSARGRRRRVHVAVGTAHRTLNPPGPTAALDQLERVARSGDVIAIQPPSKGVELDWMFGVRSDDGPVRAVQLPALDDAVALALTGHRPSGRIWLVQFTRQKIDFRNYETCARTWNHGPTRMLCIRHRFARGFPRGTPPTIEAIYRRHPDHDVERA